MTFQDTLKSQGKVVLSSPRVEKTRVSCQIPTWALSQLSRLVFRKVALSLEGLNYLSDFNLATSRAS